MRELLERVEATELALFKGGYRDLSSAVYRARLRIVGELRSFERFAATPQAGVAKEDT